MVYTMDIYVDGGCRGNGRPGAYGAAAAVFMMKWGRSTTWTRTLPRNPTPTNQRAEITAIMLALEQALEKYQDLDTSPRLQVTIHSDSRYAVNIMTTWIYEWSTNGWRNARGREVVNRDIIQEASDLDDRLKELGSVTYTWIARADNEIADQAVNDAMDAQYRAMNNICDSDEMTSSDESY